MSIDATENTSTAPRKAPGVPIHAPGPDGKLRQTGYLVKVACANCGKLTPAVEMVRDREDGSFHCTECPGEEWLARTHGPRAAAALVALREGGAHPDYPEGVTLDAINARYADARATKANANGLILEVLDDRGALTVYQIDALLRDRGKRIGPDNIRVRLRRMELLGLVAARRGRGSNAPAYWSLAERGQP